MAVPAFAGAAALFCFAALLNAGGYRYGVGDQAFYIPAILRHLNPALFPQDRVLIDVQDRLLLFNAAVAWMVRHTGVSIFTLFALGQIVTLTLLFAALASIGRVFYRSRWTVSALAAAMTLRHGIATTGVNTLEGYFHPRVLVFALGASALAFYLRGRLLVSFLLVALGLTIHPTTALWFAIWLAIAATMSSRRLAPALLALAGLTLAGVTFLRTTSTGRVLTEAALSRMDDQWLAALTEKDYLFVDRWPISSWLVHLAGVVVLISIHQARRRTGAARPLEHGMVMGCLTLVAIFLLSVPLVLARVALAIQLQISRVFWMVDFTATILLVWWLAEGWHTRAPARAPDIAVAPPGRASATPRPPLVAVFLILATLARGTYISLVEHPERPLAEARAPSGPWTDALRWVQANTPVDSGVLADPGHAWRYGTSLRVTAERDVFLENVKDSAMALYARPLAVRVLARAQELDDFTALTTERARVLADRYGLDYLVAEQRFDLPIAYENPRFKVYRLRGRAGVAVARR